MIGTCTFSQSLCGWTNSLNDGGDWKIYANDTPSFNTGPHYDFDGNGRWSKLLGPGQERGHIYRHRLGGVVVRVLKGRLSNYDDDGCENVT